MICQTTCWGVHVCGCFHKGSGKICSKKADMIKKKSRGRSSEYHALLFKEPYIYTLYIIYDRLIMMQILFCNRYWTKARNLDMPSDMPK